MSRSRRDFARVLGSAAVVVLAGCGVPAGEEGEEGEGEGEGEGEEEDD